MTKLSQWLSGLMAFLGTATAASNIGKATYKDIPTPETNPRDAGRYTQAVRLRNSLKQGFGWMLVGHSSHSSHASHSSHSSHASHYSGSSSGGTYTPSPETSHPAAASTVPASSPSSQERREQGLANEKGKQATTAAPVDQAAVAAAEVAKLIMRMQLSLNARGYCNCTVDGKFGQGTQVALKKFQKDNALKVTGLPDTETLKKLGVAF